jgi:membrane protein YqaA with SNARE-associated domain|tara:strand:+ start:2600 stop:3049 length:450 start_codon:yes stop_codon:yes gene_type:complete
MEYYVELGYLGLFIASFLAATVIPFSSEIVLSVLIANDYDFITCLSFASIGNWLGGISSYALGYIGNWKTLERYFGVKKSKVRFIKKYVDRWDSPLAFLCWLPLLGDIFAVGLGFFRVRFTYVAMWMLIGKILRYTIWGVLTLWGISLF